MALRDQLIEYFANGPFDHADIGEPEELADDVLRIFAQAIPPGLQDEGKSLDILHAVRRFDPANNRRKSDG